MLKERKNIKIYIKTMIISIIIFLQHSGIGAQNVWVREHEPARDLITNERLAAHIGFLTDSLCLTWGAFWNISLSFITYPPFSQVRSVFSL